MTGAVSTWWSIPASPVKTKQPMSGICCEIKCSMRDYFLSLTQLLFEAAVCLRVPDGGADKDLWGRTEEDL